MNESALDTIGWEIVRALQENARLSFKALGRRVGLSPPAVAERVRRLEDAGVITGYQATVDPAQLGWPIGAIIRLVTPVDHAARVVAAVRALPEIAECHRVTGGDSYILTARVTTMEHLE